MNNSWYFDRMLKIGLLKDKTQSWTISFSLVGVIMICGGLVAGTIPLYTCYKKKKGEHPRI
jgi:hypothetical protein